MSIQNFFVVKIMVVVPLYRITFGHLSNEGFGGAKSSTLI